MGGEFHRILWVDVMGKWREIVDDWSTLLGFWTPVMTDIEDKKIYKYSGDSFQAKIMNKNGMSITFHRVLIGSEKSVVPTKTVWISKSFF